MTRILCFAGSAREQSWNKILARVVAAKVDAAGAAATFLDLRDFEMPIYDGDVEAADGPPPAAFELANLMVGHDAFIIACPEYNSSITPLLKNTIDWVSRTGKGGPGLQAFQGRVIGLCATSPGGLGGIRGLVTVRSIFGNIGAFVVPAQVAVPKAPEVFGTDGTVRDEGVAKRIDALVAEVVETARKLHG